MAPEQCWNPTVPQYSRLLYYRAPRSASAGFLSRSKAVFLTAWTPEPRPGLGEHVVEDALARAHLGAGTAVHDGLGAHELVVHHPRRAA